MSTRSRIAVQIGSQIRSIYCHFDGYPSNNGKILLENYPGLVEILPLIELGNLSILGTTIGEKHDFNSHAKNDRTDCLAYGRDRGEKNCEAVTHRSVGELMEFARESWGEYVYLYRNGQWHYAPVAHGERQNNFRKLTEKACREGC